MAYKFVNAPLDSDIYLNGSVHDVTWEDIKHLLNGTGFAISDEHRDYVTPVVDADGSQLTQGQLVDVLNNILQSLGQD